MLTRRRFLLSAASALALPPGILSAWENDLSQPMIQRKIPSSGELLPVIGVGTSRTFDMDSNPETLEKLSKIIHLFFGNQGRVIDSSPMYGNAESRVGDILRSMKDHPKVFSATKVWTTGREQGIAEMQASARRMNVKHFDLIAVHNLVSIRPICTKTMHCSQLRRSRYFHRPWWSQPCVKPFKPACSGCSNGGVCWIRM